MPAALIMIHYALMEYEVKLFMMKWTSCWQATKILSHIPQSNNGCIEEPTKGFAELKKCWKEFCHQRHIIHAWMACKIHLGFRRCAVPEPLESSKLGLKTPSCLPACCGKEQTREVPILNPKPHKLSNIQHIGSTPEAAAAAILRSWQTQKQGIDKKPKAMSDLQDRSSQKHWLYGGGAQTPAMMMMITTTAAGCFCPSSSKLHNR